MALGPIPIASDQIEDYQPARRQCALLTARGFKNLLVSVPRGRIAMPVQELRVGQFGVRGARLRRALQIVARFGGIAFAFQLPRVGREIVGGQRKPMQ